VLDIFMFIGLLSKKTLTPLVVLALVVLAGFGLIFRQIKRENDSDNFYAKEKWIFVAVNILAIFSFFIFIYLIFL